MYQFESQACRNTTMKFKNAVLTVLPILSWLPKYRKSYIVGDLLSGITVCLTVIPQSIAFALLAGLPPQYGFYSSFVGPLVYTLFGGISEISVGPTTLLALMCSNLTSLDLAYAQLLSFTSGLAVLLAGILRLGKEKL